MSPLWHLSPIREASVDCLYICPRWPFKIIIANKTWFNPIYYRDNLQVGMSSRSMEGYVAILP